MSERIDTEGRIKKKFKEQDRHFLGLVCDNIKMDRTVRNVIDVVIADAAIATSGIDDDDDDTTSMDSQPHEPPAIWAERERVQNEANHAKGPNVAPVYRECTFAEFMKCSSITFRRNEGAEIQRMEGELWNLRVKEMDISSYTTRFNKLVILCPGMIPTERKKVEAYIRGLSKNIKGEVTSSELATLNKTVRMAHTLMEQKVKAIAEREADNKKRKWENFQGGSSSGGGNNNSNRNNNNYNSN
nr:reverse transcriptase domain-containing protein [Tanacetum cinerariifolium]